MDKDKEFWITVRAALIMFVRAIEKRWDIKEKPVPLGDYDMVDKMT